MDILIISWGLSQNKEKGEINPVLSKMIFSENTLLFCRFTGKLKGSFLILKEGGSYDKRCI